MDDLAAGITITPEAPEPIPDKAAPAAIAAPEVASEPAPEPELPLSGGGRKMSGAEAAPSESQSEPEPEPSPPPTPLESAERVRATQEQEQFAAAQRERAYLAEVEALRAERARYNAALTQIAERLGPSDGEPTADQWNALREADPTRYATEWADYQRREMHRQGVQGERARIAAQQQQEHLSRLHQAVEAERALMHKAIPALADPQRGAEELRSLRAYAATLGYSDREIDQAYDHRMIVAVHKARLYDQHVAAQLAAAKTKIAHAPQMPAPAGRAAFQNPRTTERSAAQRRFDQTGRIEDAISLIIN
jgi:hypothetical protein